MTDNQIPRAGNVKIEGESATLVFERLLPHPVERVWKAITSPNELSKWHMKAEIEGKVGGKVEFSSEAGRVSGGILSWDPPHVFEHEWIVSRPEFPKAEYGIIRWELLSRGDHTFLKLTHRNLPPQTAHYFAPGAHALADRLEAYLDKTPLPDWSEQVEELRVNYAHGF